jgi:hypothetical protein
MALQQGVFMCLGSPAGDMFSNLTAPSGEGMLRAVKIVFSRSGRPLFLEKLRRMNISRETLFPGLDGLARSLEHQLLETDGAQDALLQAIRLPSGWPGPANRMKPASRGAARSITIALNPKSRRAAS